MLIKIASSLLLIGLRSETYLDQSDILIMSALGKDPVEHSVARLPHEHLVAHGAREKFSSRRRCHGRDVSGDNELVWLLLMSVYLMGEGALGLESELGSLLFDAS